MKRTTLRAAGVSALAAVAFGIAVPAASAATPAPVRTVAVVQTADVQQKGSVSSSAADVTTAPGVGGPSNGEAGASVSLKPVWEAIKKSGLARKAWEAAKKGQTGFVAWVDSLSNFNPAKWAIKALPGYMTQELITYILNNYAG
ncbi:hypothetical protein HET69_13115 [Streptomyces sp. CJ_13]|uniref:hypothetical protein n=1 Tax=Streptomyces sp. CJ_13 TaxID=2724943 RepID=UPI001BDD006B|nr:hypothetical protein [Streptomyces sp. CJ_13]MBT1184940.1 hypothetical protein [Streptomyces sp. CJ_13]